MIKTFKRWLPILTGVWAFACALPAVADGVLSFLPSLPLLGKKVNLDLNGDGVVRVTLLSPATHAGGIEAAAWAADLEAMLKSVVRKNVRVTLELPGDNQSLMGWWYSPDTREARERLFASQIDLLLIAEHEKIVTTYPEFFFEGVCRITERARAKNLSTALVLMSKPGISHRDRQLGHTANVVYRVGAGCGIPVIPAGYGWKQVLLHNRLPGDTPVKSRACAYLAAAAVFCHLTDQPLPRNALEAFWTTRKTTEQLALSAQEAVANERVRSHYTGPFRGTVRIEPKNTTDLKIYLPTSQEEDPIRQNLAFILSAANLRPFFKSPADWYTDGLDRFTVPFNLVYGDQQQMAYYLDRSIATGTLAPTNLPPPSLAVFTRLPEGLAQSDDILRRLESLLFNGYDYAHVNNLIYIPYPLAWARAHERDAALTLASDSGRRNDWLTFMIASMIYTSCTGRFQPPTEEGKPHSANKTHPAGHHDLCARIGYGVMTQLASLSAADNTILMRNETTRVEENAPCFASLRLMNKPQQDVRVYCGTDIPQAVTLSRDTILFTPDTFDIEQTIRIAPATNTPALFVSFMASAQSGDPAIDGKSDVRPLILNFDESAKAGFTLSTNAASPTIGFHPQLSPTTRPTAIVALTVRQHGIPTQELFFSSDAASSQALALHPTTNDYAKGLLSVEIRAASRDLRFDGQTQTLTFALSREGIPLPAVALADPTPDRPIPGPAFVNAAAEAAAPQGIRSVTLYLEKKTLAHAVGTRCTAAVEKGPPQSRLAPGRYPVWAEAETPDGLILATEPLFVEITEKNE